MVSTWKAWRATRDPGVPGSRFLGLLLLWGGRLSYCHAPVLPSMVCLLSGSLLGVVCVCFREGGEGTKSSKEKQVKSDSGCLTSDL